MSQPETEQMDEDPPVIWSIAAIFGVEAQGQIGPAHPRIVSGNMEPIVVVLS